MKENTKDTKKDVKQIVKENKPSVIKKFKENLATNREKQKLINDWIKVMVHSKAYNRNMDSFEISDEEITSYGWHFRLFCPWGLTFDKLADLKSIIEHNLKCHFVYEVMESNSFAVCDIIYENKISVNKIPFEPLKVKPYEFYMGVKINGKPLCTDINMNPFLLIGGATRRGKNGALNHGLISLIHSCSLEEIRILYYQGAKGDGWIYKNCEQVYAWAMGDFVKLLQMCNYCREEMNRRTKLFESMYTQFKGDNILAYNKMHKHDKLPYIYLVIDEFLVVNPDKSDSKELKEIKTQIIDVLSKLAQFGGALGITYIICHQKPEKELCPTFLKNMSNTRVCFGFEDEICSRIVLGNDLAKGLPPRRAYVLMNGRLDLIFTTNLENRMEKYLKPHYKNKRRDLFEDLKKLQTSRIDLVSKSKVKNKDTTNNRTKGKEDISKDNELIRREDEIKRKELLISQQEELLKKQESQLKKLEENIKSMQEKILIKQHDTKYNYDMVEPPQNLLEANISNIDGFVPYEPIGKEKVVK